MAPPLIIFGWHPFWSVIVPQARAAKMFVAVLEGWSLVPGIGYTNVPFSTWGCDQKEEAMAISPLVHCECTCGCHCCGYPLAPGLCHQTRGMHQLRLRVYLGGSKPFQHSNRYGVARRSPASSLVTLPNVLVRLHQLSGIVSLGAAGRESSRFSFCRLGAPDQGLVSRL